MFHSRFTRGANSVTFYVSFGQTVLRGRALWLSLHKKKKKQLLRMEFEGPKVFPIQMRNSI